MKVCRECKIEKPLFDFYKHSRMADGHLNKCIECVKTRVDKHREANLEKIREYDKKRGNQPHRVEAREKYAKTEAGQQARKRANVEQKKRYPMRYAARKMTGNAVRDGKLIKSTNCSICNSAERIEGHHDDYTKPLEVRWLCKSCHTKWHQHNNPIYE